VILPDPDTCYRAVQARDPRFDGWFFIAVRTTGIYCRPSCPAITPKRCNVEFHPSAASAQRAGFRACKRCRPDASPGSPEWDVRGDLAGRALRLISDGVIDRDGVPGLARRLGYSERQLNRTLLARSNKDPIGDIDVLVADRAQRTLYSIDTKDHALARNPYEMDIESRHIFERVGRHPSLADRHLERDAWLRQHRTDALAHLRLDSSGPPWRVVSLLVFDRVLAVTARRGLPLPLLDVTTLEERVRGGSVLVTPAELRGRPAASDHGRAGFDIARAE